MIPFLLQDCKYCDHMGTDIEQENRNLHDLNKITVRHLNRASTNNAKIIFNYRPNSYQFKSKNFLNI